MSGLAGPTNDERLAFADDLEIAWRAIRDRHSPGHPAQLAADRLEELVHEIRDSPGLHIDDLLPITPATIAARHHADHDEIRYARSRPHAYHPSGITTGACTVCSHERDDPKHT